VNHLKNKNARPNLYIIAGPNGAGKTTFARKFLPQYVQCLEFVNADLIAGGLSPLAPEKGALRAGRIMLEQIYSLGNRGLDFGFETTLSGKSYIRFLNELKQKKGYGIHLFFLWIASVKLALERIELRVRQGGHNIPEAVVRRRFDKGLSNFFQLYQPIVDRWIIFNNSGDVPEVVAFEESGTPEIVDPDRFALLLRYKEKQWEK
jgi:predicted ABC-type ATPase